MAEKFDLVVIGAGPGGYVAALRAAQLGLKTACVERERAGGICLNWGCIPTKALLKSAAAMRTVKHAGDFGIKIGGEITFDWTQVIKRSRGVSDKLAGGVEHLFRKYGVEHITGSATLTGRGRMDVKTAGGLRTLEAPRIIVATGARARALPGITPDGERIITYREAMVLPERPDSVVVIGAGAIGCEFADFWNAFGAEVTIVEAAPRIVPVEDEEVSEALTRAFKKKGIKVNAGCKVTSVKVEGQKVTTTFEGANGKSQTVVSDRLLLAAGVQANTEGMGLEGMGVQLDRGFIKADRSTYQTTSPGIYAIGDCAGPPMLAHKASSEAIACVEKMAGAHHPGVNYGAIPGCTYCEPEIASIGKTEKQAQDAGLDIAVGRFPFSVNGKALGAGHTDGFIKVIVDKGDHNRIVGMHAIGAGVTDLVAEMSLAINTEATAHDILATVHPHPTLSEVVMEAVASALGESVHI
ncbi:MAG: dihydrolipoyl dehydrogenase [Myxococcales bacterium]|nr:dihydrolipoyl dehydrogenase [Myxococcales bacterium]